MKILRSAAVVAAASLAAGSVHAATEFRSTINAAQIVGGSTSTGFGTATATLLGGPGTWEFRYSATFEGYDWGSLFFAAPRTAYTGDDVRNFHIHIGNPGFTGPLTYSVRQPDYELTTEPTITFETDTRVTISGVWNVADGNFNANAAANTQVGNLNYWAQQMIALQPGESLGLYFDIHTNDYPGSAIRGQIVAAPLPASVVLMAGGLSLLRLIRRRSSI